jgi:pimeloyl-ACP methyl ester carboxylesterase
MGTTLRAAIDTREVITATAGGMCLRGTHHRPKDQARDSLPSSDDKKHTGVLFLSGSAEPRAAFGDSAVHWADWLAECGYRCFRFDLPGIGDSDGNLPRTEPAFMSFLNSGAFCDSVCGISDNLTARFNLRDLIIVGHCSGAVTAIYAGAANERISGLVLLDPYFHLQSDSEFQNSLFAWHWRLIARLVGDGSAPAYLRAVRLHSSLRSLYRRQTLPGILNKPLIRNWNRLVSRNFRILILRSSAFMPKPGAFDFISYHQPFSNDDCRITVKLVEGATHDFAERHIREAVRTHTERWLSAFLQPAKCPENTEHETPAHAAHGLRSGTDPRVH